MAGRRTGRGDGPDLDGPDFDNAESWPTGRLLSTAARLLESRFADVLAEHDLTHAGLIVLHHLASGTRTQRELATLCRVTDQTMSRTIARLHRHCLVTRDPDSADRRRSIATITPEGTRLLGIARREEQESTLLLGVLDDPPSFRGQLLKIIYSGA